MTNPISPIDPRTPSAQAQALTEAQSAMTNNSTAKATTATRATNTPSTGDTVHISVSAQVIQLSMQGETAEQIAQQLGLTVTEVQQYLNPGA